MVDLVPLIISFALGITCSSMVCCIGMYLGLFAYLGASDTHSRIRGGLTSLLFATGVVVVVAALGLGVLILQISVSHGTGNSGLIIDIVGFSVLAILGASYLTGRQLILPILNFGPPKTLMTMRGYKAAPLYGAYFGGPGAAHCTFALVIPILFLGLSEMDPAAILWNFLAYAVGRVIPVVIVGMLFQDSQVRFAKFLSSHSVAMNRAMGVIILLSGVSLFFFH